MDTAFLGVFSLAFLSSSYALTDIGLHHVSLHRNAENYLYDKHYREQFQPTIERTCASQRGCSRGILNPRDACAYIIPRVEWRARETRHAKYIANPVSIVFIHHTVMERCDSHSQCMQAMHKVQEFHMDVKGWDDIAYSFVVGEDGRAYEARGYDRVGAHTLDWNNVSISIAVMGNFTEYLPNGPALEAINNVIECGIQLGKVMPDYKLYGHCDARPMFESPGKMLYPLIKTWPHYEYRIPIEKLQLKDYLKTSA